MKINLWQTHRTNSRLQSFIAKKTELESEIERDREYREKGVWLLCSINFFNKFNESSYIIMQTTLLQVN